MKPLFKYYSRQTWFLFAFVLSSVGISAFAQPSATSQTNLETVPSVVVDIGPQSRTWQNADGHKVVEMGTGMNYWDGQQWSPSNPSLQITPDGQAAVANQLPYKAKLAANLNSIGAISMQTPDGITLNSSPIGIGLYDAASGNFSLIATVTNCSGYLVSSNKSVYSNAFNGICADIVYTTDRGAFNQDVVITGHLNPADYGFPTNTTWIQIVTEFYDVPNPQVLTRPLRVEKNLTVRNAMASPDLIDQTLGFGQMVFGPGRAYTTASVGPVTKRGVQVGKQFTTVGNRTFLVESLEYRALQKELDALPDCQISASATGAMLKAKKRKQAYAMLPTPPKKAEVARFVQPSADPAVKLARVDPPARVVIDYVVNDGGNMNTPIVFQGDTTYFISSTLNCNAAATIEGGAVFKYPTFDTGSGVGQSIQLNNSLVLTSCSYRPAIFTAGDDNSVGASVAGMWSGYTGNPSGQSYAAPALSLNFDYPSISNLRFRYANQAIGLNDYSISVINISDCQFVNCIEGIDYSVGSGLIIAFNNCLMANVQNPLAENGNEGNTYFFNNCTFDTSTNFVDTSGGSLLNFTNCILANISTDTSGFSGAYNGFYNSAASTFGSGKTFSLGTPFQSCLAGNYYLLTNSSFTNAGTLNIPTNVLLDIEQKTVFAPVVYFGISFSTPTTLSSMVQRDTNAYPSLGYHYDPIDYGIGGVYVTNTTLTIGAGAVIARFETNYGVFPSGVGLMLSPGGTLVSQGTPNNLNRIVEFNMVQEEYSTTWNTPKYGLITANSSNTGASSAISCRFTDFSVAADDTSHLYAVKGNNAPINFQDCQFHGGSLTSTNSTVNLTNCLLERVTTKLWSYDANTPTIRNCLFWYGTNDIQFPGKSATIIQDNFFDHTGVNDHASTGYTGAYNGYVTNTSHLTLTNATDQFLPNSAYQSGPLGNYYLPTNSLLINAGNTTADEVGLYHYTTQTNQIKETNSLVDIGYHYVALNTNGLPCDSNGDGNPDYLQDVLGNGRVIVTLTAPTNGAYFMEPAIIPLQAVISGWGGNLTNVQFFSGSTPVGNVANSPYNRSWPLVGAGAYTITAAAYDASGIVSTSASIGVTVTNLCTY